MADAKPESVFSTGQFQVLSFRNPIKTSQITTALTSDNGCYIALLYKEGQVRIVDQFANGTEVVCVATEFTAVHISWIHTSDGEERLVIQSQDGHLHLYSVGTDILENTDLALSICHLCQCHINTLHSLLNDSEIDVDLANYRLLQGSGNYPILRVGSYIVTLDWFGNQLPTVESVLEVEGILSPLTAQLVLSSNPDDGCTELWDIERSTSLATIQTSDFLTQPPKYSILTESLNYAVFLDAEKIYAVNLNSYLKTDPNSSRVLEQAASIESNISQMTIQSQVSRITMHSQVTPRREKSQRREKRWDAKLTKISRKSTPTTFWLPLAGLGCREERGALRTQIPPTNKRKTHFISSFAKNKAPAFHTLVDDVVSVHDLGLDGAEIDMKSISSTGNQLTYMAQYEGVASYHIVDMDTRHHSKTSLPVGGILIPSRCSSFPSLVIAPDKLMVLSPNLSQEQLVSRLMLYDSAGVADSLCRSNGWDRCTIPIHALEVGLKHRQLDTVAFFLKSRENVFVSHNMDSLPSRSTSSPGRSPTSLPRCGDLDLGQVEPAIELLLRTVSENITENQSKQFAEQLLHLTLNFLHKVTMNINEQLTKVRAASRSQPAFEAEVADAMSKVMDYMSRLRHYIPGTKVLDRQRRQRVDSVDNSEAVTTEGATLTDDQKKLLQNWRSMSYSEVVTDGILAGEVSLLQLHMKNRSGSRAALFAIVDFGLKTALEYLQERQLLLATQIFSNLGFDVWTKLRQVCLYTADRELRDYLIDELMVEGHLTPEEAQMVVFVHHLESLYSCQSFELAKVLKADGIQCHWSTKIDLSLLMSPNKSDKLNEYTGEIAPCDIVNSETASYSHIILEWIRSWNSDEQQAIELDQVVNRKDASLTEGISSDIVWCYLLARHDFTRLKQWMDEAFPQMSTNSIDVPQLAPHRWPFNLRLTPDSLVAIKDCDQRTQNLVLDYLARRCVLGPQEASDPELVVKRLSRTCTLLNELHILNRTSSGLVLADLHHYMVALCIEYRLPELLYFYLDYWNLCHNSSDLTEVGLSVSNFDPWVSTLLHARTIAQDPSDLNRVYEASLAGSLFKKPSSSSTMTIGDLLDRGLVGRALTTLVYRPDQLHEMVSTENGQNATPSICQWQSLLSLFPRLQTALCQRLTDGVGAQDITMYHLLQGNAPFDVTTLFGWQITNSLYCGDSFSKMPHFASADLAARFSHHVSLNFTHYLRQARPSFAFCALIISLLNAGKKTLSARRLKAIVLQVNRLAVRQFAQRPVAAACVAFLEMLGCDTTVLRIRLQAAGLICDHQNSQIDGSAEQRHAVEGDIEKNISWLLFGCMKRQHKCQQEILTLLEDAIRWQVERLSLKSSSPETLILWQLAVMYCQAHDLLLTTGYLADCAKSNDWLMFLTFAHMHNYDKDLVHSELHHFAQHALHEHLHYIVENVSTVTSAKLDDQQRPDVSVAPRDIRAQLYSRIGLTRHSEKVGDSTSGETDTSEEEQVSDKLQMEQPDESDGTIPTDLLNNPSEEDVFGILLACDSTRNPSHSLTTYAVRFRNPVLAVLAACYQDHITVGCLCSWLVASATDHAYQTMVGNLGPLDAKVWSIDDLRCIILILTKNDLFKTLLDGLHIFCPDVLIVVVVRFCVAFHQHDDVETCRQHLETFKTQHSAMLHKSHHDNTDTMVDEKFTLEWTESLVLEIVIQTLRSMKSSYDFGRLLKLLDQTNAMRLFTNEVPDFSRLYRLHQMISPTGVTINYHNLTCTSDPKYAETCQQALNALEDRHMFNEARVFAEVAGVSSEMITIRQMESELVALSKSAVWKDTGARCTFWKKCHETFSRHQVSKLIASGFFQGKISACASQREKGLMCQLAYDWLEVDDQTVNQRLKKDLFVQIWMCKIRDHMEKEKKSNEEDTDWVITGVSESPAPVHRSELLQYGHIPSEVDGLQLNLTQEERSALEALIGQLLDRGKVKDACQVAALVGHYSQDLSIVIACLKLALGHTTPEELNMSMRKLVSSPAPRISRRLSVASFTMATAQESSQSMSRRFSTTGLMNMPTVPSTASLWSLDETVGESENDVLHVLKLLSAHVTKGQFCCQRILTAYQISQVLLETFEWTVMQDEFVVLQALLNCNHAEKFPLAKEFLSTSGLPAAQVAGFLSEAIMKLLNSHGNAVESGPVGNHEVYEMEASPSVVAEMVLKLIHLCDDPTTLGRYLHDNVTSTTSSNHDMAQNLLSVCVELIVAAHHCFTLACSMEGIAAVLRSARKLTELLAQADEFNLLIRLLTGVGRFSEMTYIFEILKQQHQLELLFRKGIDKDEGLRVAILDYIQRVHPSDTDTYKMVSLYFTMYREIATMLEETAKRQLTDLKGKPLENTSEVSSMLQSVVHYFSDAAESYVKQNCLRHAARCVHQARLVALQLQLLTSGQCVVNLTKQDVGAFVANHPKFWEAYMVAEAYEDHSHWALALCRRYVMQGDGKYLTDLQRHITLSATLIVDVADRYKCEAHRPKSAASQMRKLLSQCPDVVVMYRTALDLGFTDYSHDLLKGDSSAYLRDSISLLH